MKTMQASILEVNINTGRTWEMLRHWHKMITKAAIEAVKATVWAMAVVGVEAGARLRKEAVSTRPI